MRLKLSLQLHSPFPPSHHKRLRHRASPCVSQSGWGDLLEGKYEMVLDESTGEMIMVEKGAKKYKLDGQGNIINPPPAAAPAPAAPSPFSAMFAPAPASGFVFGGGEAAAANGFVFGGTPAASGFIFGGAPATPPQQEKRAGAQLCRTAVKRQRTRELRLSGNESGAVFVVGNGDCGQLGLGAGDEDVRDSLVPLRLKVLDSVRVVSLACGGMHTAALTAEGQVWTWGCNDDEVLGRQEEESEPHPVRGALEGAVVTSVSAGDSHMAVLLSTGKVYSWGTYKDSNGYIGYSKALQKAREPTLVPNLPEVKAIACGADHTLAIARDGYSIYTWGCGEKGQLGRDLPWDASVSKEAKKEHLVPTEPLTIRLHDSSGLAVRERLQLALNENLLGAVRRKVEADAAVDLTEACELYLQHRQKLEQADAALEPRLKIRGVYGGAYHSFALTARGNVYAFGLNNMGQLGLGSLEPGHTATPTLVGALEDKRVCHLVGGEHHSLALTEAGEVYAFGRGDSGQLGFVAAAEVPTPRLVDSFDGVAVRQLASGSNQVVCVSRTGDMYAWGFGEMGQLCNGRCSIEPTPSLVEASELRGMAVLAAASGAQHSVLLATERAD
ncbi:hypothetical protein AB1Y20_015589 [Prymnesium parvum]|uniref:RCC1-like domain-containing protein n=1 Tax=Prymnesium parvum TaxID=97485 RepID=A0AB34K190_PRYPA